MTKPNDCAFVANAERDTDPGLTKREYFAAMAMQGMLANGSLNYGSDFGMINEKAVICADQLIEKLNTQ